MKTLYVVRHGQTEWNVARRMQGRLDSALTEAGQQHAIRNGELIKAQGGVDHLFVSPAGRTQETAYLLNSFLGAAMTFDESLLERDCGHWSGLTEMEIEERFPTEWQARIDDPFDYRPPGGESVADLVERVEPFLDSLFGAPHERIAIVTHGIMSRAILSKLLSLSKKMANSVRHPNDLVYRLEFHPTEILPSYFRAGEGPVRGLFTKDLGADSVQR
ncbi:MAG: histidine phosphatase family protein [Pseudomonadota bacterium]